MNEVGRDRVTVALTGYNDPKMLMQDLLEIRDINHRLRWEIHHHKDQIASGKRELDRMCAMCQELIRTNAQCVKQIHQLMPKEDADE